MKKKYIILYDYGTGGLWGTIMAKSKREINEKYPELKVFEKLPDFFTSETAAVIMSPPIFDIDEPPTDWLKAMVEERPK